MTHAEIKSALCGKVACIDVRFLRGILCSRGRRRLEGREGGMEQEGLYGCGGARTRGFTLLEMLLTAVVFAIVAAMSITALDLIPRNQIISGTGEVISALGMARGEAILRQVPVALCVQDKSLVKGWGIVVGNPECKYAASGDWEGEVLFARAEPFRRLFLCTADCGVSTPEKFVFTPLGNLEGGPATAILCVTGLAAAGRRIEVNAAGMVKSRTYECPS
jgi:prepilin-type N-terminal cleavage/methylation domain-containing protein